MTPRYLFTASILLLAGMSIAEADPVSLRIVASNLTSGPRPEYAPSNANHSNIEGAGTRILKGLKPDIVLIQEFNTTVDTQEWVNTTFGDGYTFIREQGTGIPNGVVSRYPIEASGEWDDTTQENRDFAWARIALPNGKKLWAISVHLKASDGAANIRTRVEQAEILVNRIRAAIPAEDYMVLGGDFNTQKRQEQCVTKLGQLFHTDGPHPVDQADDGDTNSSRSRRGGKPYDWVLADRELKERQVQTLIGEKPFPNGFVLDTRIFSPLSLVAPAKQGDSGVQNMQHMAVVKDFVIP